MIKQFSVDGVPALHSPASGPTRVALAFRVGIADETLPNRGITHLLEHLALFSAGVVDRHHNGATGTEYTYFQICGSDSEVVAFLEGVCASLARLPMQRLQVEKEILRTEQASRPASMHEHMALWRHGARDFGLTGYRELGLPAISEDHLRAWAARYFVRQNAVLWVTGATIPEGLRLALPDGARQPVPAPSSALPVRPAYFQGPSGVVIWDTVVPREPAAAVFAGVLERELLRALRQEGGLSYAVNSYYAPRRDDSALITAGADALVDKQDAVLGGMVDVLTALRVGRIDPADVAAVIDRKCERMTQADEMGDRLAAVALDLLAGRPVTDLDEALTATRAVTPADVIRVAADAYANGLLCAPGPSRVEWAGYAAVPTNSRSPVPGTTYRSLEDRSCRLVVGDRGASLVDEAAGESVTVRFDECVAMLVWPDGARRLIGADAIALQIEPTLFSDLAPAIAGLDARVPPRLRIPMPARPGERIPAPRSMVAGRLFMTRRAGHRLVRRRPVLLAIMLVAGAVAVKVGALALDIANGARTGSFWLEALYATVAVAAAIPAVWATRLYYGR